MGVCNCIRQEKIHNNKVSATRAYLLSLRMGGVKKDTRTRAEVAIIYCRATENGHKFINYPARVCVCLRVCASVCVAYSWSPVAIFSCLHAMRLQLNRLAT